MVEIFYMYVLCCVIMWHEYVAPGFRPRNKVGVEPLHIHMLLYCDVNMWPLGLGPGIRSVWSPCIFTCYWYGYVTPGSRFRNKVGVEPLHIHAFEFDGWRHTTLYDAGKIRLLFSKGICNGLLNFFMVMFVFIQPFWLTLVLFYF